MNGTVVKRTKIDNWIIGIPENNENITLENVNGSGVLLGEHLVGFSSAD